MKPGKAAGRAPCGLIRNCGLGPATTPICAAVGVGVGADGKIKITSIDNGAEKKPGIPTLSLSAIKRDIQVKHLTGGRAREAANIQSLLAFAP
ncbi:hypothetical protein MNBD_DELTA01-1403 [hydrothermal vent metagenome]|uniref:Uncharacterized protein n=1 Tax=hydrothermal vent metagenome TaxID=652676 RepID=A0A3B0R2N6_9ZZZZ